MTKWITILLALLGAGIALYTVATNGKDKAPAPPPATAPSVNPFARGIACAGSVEALSRNIAVSAPEGGLVVQTLAEVGAAVNAGDPLFVLDSRLLAAELVRAQAARTVAAAELAALLAAPRPEELPPLAAALDAAKVREADARDVLADMTTADRQSAMSRSEMARRRFALDQAVADVARAQALLDLTAAGAWKPQVEVARARLAAAEADIAAINLRIDRLTVRAPIAGTVLKRNVEPGQFTGGMGGPGMGGGAGGGGGGMSSSPGSAAIVVGDLSRLRIRARVDEEDAPLLRAAAKAVARVRGIAPETLELRMVRIEPLALPKADLTGATTERVDTRVIEVLFEVLTTPSNPVFPGQAVDVYIEAPPA